MNASRLVRFLVTLAAVATAGIATAQDNKLRLITWADYVPADVVAQFKKETGIDVEITLSNNEEMISKLRATGAIRPEEITVLVLTGSGLNRLLDALRLATSLPDAKPAR